MCIFHLQAIDVSLHDASEPQPLALPHYGGEVYIYVALVLGGVWLFSTGPLIITLGYMVVSLSAAYDELVMPPYPFLRVCSS